MAEKKKNMKMVAFVIESKHVDSRSDVFELISRRIERIPDLAHDPLIQFDICMKKLDGQGKPCDELNYFVVMRYEYVPERSLTGVSFEDIELVVMPSKVLSKSDWEKGFWDIITHEQTISDDE